MQSNYQYQWIRIDFKHILIHLYSSPIYPSALQLEVLSNRFGRAADPHFTECISLKPLEGFSFEALELPCGINLQTSNIIAMCPIGPCHWALPIPFEFLQHCLDRKLQKSCSFTHLTRIGLPIDRNTNSRFFFRSEIFWIAYCFSHTTLWALRYPSCGPVKGPSILRYEGWGVLSFLECLVKNAND